VARLELLIHNIKYKSVAKQGSLIGFASLVVSEGLFVGSIGVHRRKNGGIRLVYPQKNGYDIFYPINSSLGKIIENEVEIMVAKTEINNELKMDRR